MNIRLLNRGQNGSAVIVVIAFLALLLIFVAGNLRMLHLLRNDLKVVERQQTNRLATTGLATNLPPIINRPARPEETKPPGKPLAQ
jgi:hypothetical protein